MQIKAVEFEVPVKGRPVKVFSGWVCIGYCDDNGSWYAGCDSDSADDAYADALRQGDHTLMPHTVQMFRVGDK